jgi:hypothetical protein
MLFENPMIKNGKRGWTEAKWMRRLVNLMT